MNRKLTFWWFVLGLGSKLQVVASLSITEMIVLASAPFIFAKDYQQMRRDGIMPFFVLSLLVVVGCVVASIANRTPAQYVLRGLAVTCIVSCSIIFSHWILRRDPAGFKWFILAVPFSAIISTFYFKASVEVTMLGETSEEIMSGPIYWIGRLQPLILAPTKGWYLQTPWFISVIAPLFLAAFAVTTTVSGRAATLSAIGFVALVIVGGKKIRTMRRISKNFWLICFAGILLVGGAYFGYKISASQGWLGEGARHKYEIQTSGGEGGVLRLILGGRAASFIGLLACRDKPIIGWGPWARDSGGYAEEFIKKYGTIEDIDSLYQYQANLSKLGMNNRIGLIQCHSYITEFWLWYGIFGLIFWVYVLYAIMRYMKNDLWIVPQWFAWLACSVPGMLWGIFFSPFADRFGISLSVVACLMARAVRLGTFRLPFEMIEEIARYEQK